MVKTLSISKARVHFGSLANRVKYNGDTVIVKKHGRPILVISSYDDYEDYLDLHDPEVQKRIEQSYREFKAGKFIPAQTALAKIKQRYLTQK